MEAKPPLDLCQSLAGDDGSLDCIFDLAEQSGLVLIRLSLTPHLSLDYLSPWLADRHRLRSAAGPESAVALLSLLDQESLVKLQALERRVDSSFSRLSLRLRRDCGGCGELLARLRCRQDPGAVRMIEGWLVDASLLSGESLLYSASRPDGLANPVHAPLPELEPRLLSRPPLMASGQPSQDSVEIRLRLNGGRIVWVSPSIQQLLGWKPQEWLGQPLERYLHPQSFLLQDGALQSVGPGANMVMRDRLLARDSCFHWLDFYVYPLLNGQGEQDGLAAVLRPAGQGLIGSWLADRPVRSSQMTDYQASDQQSPDQQLSFYWFLSDPDGSQASRREPMGLKAPEAPETDSTWRPALP